MVQPPVCASKGDDQAEGNCAIFQGPELPNGVLRRFVSGCLLALFAYLPGKSPYSIPNPVKLPTGILLVSQDHQNPSSLVT